MRREKRPSSSVVEDRDERRRRKMTQNKGERGLEESRSGQVLEELGLK